MDTWFRRHYETGFPDFLQRGKVWILYGPRRSGKTALLTRLLGSFDGKYYFQTGEHLPLREVLESEDVYRIKSVFTGYDLVVIDEAQKVSNIGLGLKILVDSLPEMMVIASGSSSFELSNIIGEPLTGRQQVETLYPLSVLEIRAIYGGMDILDRLEQYLIYGMYPEVLKADNIMEKREYLTTLRDSYLLKDILELENIRYSSKLTDLLKLLAFQIGKEVSINELSRSLGIAKLTVERYLDLLEKTFIIRKVRGFSRNLRKEISKMARYIFLDNGIRNSLINNFNDIQTRDDIGMLWENFLFSERLKKRNYSKIFANEYFWRTHDQKELDLVEEREGTLFGYEFKWSPRKIKTLNLWLNTYPSAKFYCINRSNFLDFIG